MDRNAYTLIGQYLIDLKNFNGINLFYNKPNATICLHTDLDLSNSTFNGNFVLPPGSFSVSSAKQIGLDLKIRPDLNSNDTLLTLDPIQKTFEFQVKKTCPCTGAGFQINFDSATKKPLLTIFPKFILKNVSTSGFVKVSSTHDVPEYHLSATRGNFTLRHVYLPTDKKLRFGCFYVLGNLGKLNDVSFGTAAAFQQLNAPTNAYFFAKASLNKTVTSLILSKDDQVLASEVRLFANIKDNCTTAASVKCVGKAVTAALGVGYECPTQHNVFNVSVNSQRQVAALATIPIQRFLNDATLGLSAVVPKVDSEFLKNPKVNFGFSLNFQ